jgi:hypothetical protein
MKKTVARFHGSLLLGVYNVEFRKVDGKLAVTSNSPDTQGELGKALSSGNFQGLAPKPAQAQQAPASPTPAPANNGAPAKP